MEHIIAKEIMGNNFIGIDELGQIEELEFHIPSIIPPIPFSSKELEDKNEDYMLILGLERFVDGSPVNIKNMISIFGKDPEISEPCFYNQDWYDKESFVETPMKTGWFMVRKSVYEESRALPPEDLMKQYSFPSAIRCAYAFFVSWKARGMKLWYHDFVWCSDTDHNGDRVYVGKYHDVDGINKNGFSIHRHLALRPCYGCVDC